MSAHPNTLSDPRRLITTHNSKGEAIFADDVAEAVERWNVAPHSAKPAWFGLGYKTTSFPVPLNGDRDFQIFKDEYADRQNMGLVKHGGSVLRYVDFPPNEKSPMHRTASLDYGVVLTGELECLLDSGEAALIKAGDVVVQRGTMHAWVNKTDQWARMLFVLLHAHEAEVDGQKLSENIEEMETVPGSH